MGEYPKAMLKLMLKFIISYPSITSSAFYFTIFLKKKIKSIFMLN